MMDSHGIYQPLEEGEFRLLRPVYLEEDDEIAFELVRYRLDDAPKYAALSYRCSEVKAGCTISVNKKPFQVGQNLYDAFYRLRDFLLTEVGYLWVDAVFISQSDSDERSQQVQMMREIYEKAYKVYIWLGWPDDPELARLGVEQMGYLDRILRRASQEHDGFNSVALANILSEDKQVFDEDPASLVNRAWQGIYAVCNVDWWHRAWVYQEASTPVPDDGGKTCLFYGSHCIFWREMYAPIYVANYLRYFQALSISGADLSPAVKLMSFWLARKSHRMCFLDLLNTFRSTVSTDPRDKVYVPLGLAQDVDHHTSLPDHRKSTVDVFIEVAKLALLRRGRELDILGYVARSLRHQPLQGLPTWVPDWTSPGPSRPFPETAGCSHGRDCQSSDYERLYHADRGRSGIIELSKKALQVHGFCVDIVSEMSSISKDRTKLTMLEDWKPALLQAEAAKDAVRRTVVADIRYNMADEPNRGNKLESSVLNASAGHLTEEAIVINHRMRVSIMYAVSKRRLCYTEHGRIGLIPEAAELGDQIAVFFGGQVLYVVRPVPDEQMTCRHHQRTMQTFNFVGECYINGLMDGEAVSETETETCIRLV